MLQFYFRFQLSRLRHNRHVMHLLPNFVQIRLSTTELWCNPFSKMVVTALQFYFHFIFLGFVHLGRSKSTCRPNFSEIPQSIAETLLLLVSENKCLPCWNSTSGFDFHLCIIIGMTFPSASQVSSKLDHPWELGYHSDFQDVGRQPYWIFSRVTADHPRSANEGISWSSNFDSIGFVVLEILLFLCWEVLAWNCLFMWLYPPCMHGIKGKSTAGVETNHMFWFAGVNLPIQHPTFWGIAGRFRMFTDKVHHVTARFEPKLLVKQLCICEGQNSLIRS